MSQNTRAAAATKSKFSVRDICYAGLLLIFWKEPTVFPRLTVSVKWVFRSKENHPVSWYTGKVCAA